MELKRAKVRRLERDSPSHIHKQLEGDLSYHDKSSKRFNFTWTQQLYLTTDDEIKEGDWVYVKDNDERVFQAKSSDMYELVVHHFLYEKVIATTDPKLKLVGYGEKDGHWYLTSPTQAFVKKYCKVGGIDEVLVEYETLFYQRDSLNDGYKGEWKTISFESYNYSITNPESLHHNWKEYRKESKLKVDSHNTITIHPFKNSWDREEMIDRIKSFAIYAQKHDDNAYKVDDWIKENL